MIIAIFGRNVRHRHDICVQPDLALQLLILAYILAETTYLHDWIHSRPFVTCQRRRTSTSQARAGMAGKGWGRAQYMLHSKHSQFLLCARHL